MKAQLICSEEFQSILREAMAQRGIGISAAAYKCGVSYEWMRKMVQMGHIPSQEVLALVAKGLDLDLGRLRLIAGYDKPRDLIELADLALRADPDISDEGRKQILDLIREVKALHRKSP